ANWWSSRLLLQRDFMAPAAGGSASAFQVQWNVWFPRVLPAIGLGWVDYYILVTRKQWLAGLGSTAVLAVSGLFVISRRKIFPVAAQTNRPSLQIGDRVALWLALSLSGVLLWTLTAHNWWMARFLGSPVILLLALGSLVLVGAVVLTYLPL